MIDQGLSIQQLCKIKSKILMTLKIILADVYYVLWRQLESWLHYPIHRMRQWLYYTFRLFNKYLDSARVVILTYTCAGAKTKPTQRPDMILPSSTSGKLAAKPSTSQAAAHSGAVSCSVRFLPARCISCPEHTLPTNAPSGGIAPASETKVRHPTRKFDWRFLALAICPTVPCGFEDCMIRFEPPVAFELETFNGILPSCNVANELEDS